MHIHIRFYIILILIVNTMTISCTTITHPSQERSFDCHYKTARDKLLYKNYTGAIEDFIYLQNLYLLNPYPQQIHLNLIYAYYKSNDLKSANDSIQKFLKLYPNYKDLDYVLYMYGIVNMSLDKNHMSFLAKYLNMHWYNFNPNYADNAFRSFKTLIKNYPKSQYYIDSYKRLIILKNRIAEYELSIIKFYNQRNAYVSVITRSEKMLRYFPDTQATYHALYYMKHAYQNIYLLEQSDKVHKIITENSTTY